MDGWPLTKLLAAAALADAARAPKLAVLLTTGALNPAHLGHLDAVRRARRCLEAEHGYTVRAAFISPSHDSYVRTKVSGAQHAKAPARLALLEALIADEPDLAPWVTAASWESSPDRSRWADFPEVIDSLRAHLDGHGLKHVTIFYCCGSDHARYIPRGFPRKRAVGLVVTARSGASIRCSEPSKLIFHVTEVNPAVEALSSTKVRGALQRAAASDARRREEAVAVVGRACGSGFFAVAQRLGVYGLTEPSSACVPAAPTAAPTAAPAAAPVALSGRRRTIFISASRLSRVWNRVDHLTLQESLFLFGSKRTWVFPRPEHAESDASEAARQYTSGGSALNPSAPSGYAHFDAGFKALIRVKEARNEVCWLKPDALRVRGAAGAWTGAAGSYGRVSDWLASVVDPTRDDGGTYAPLILKKAQWRAIHREEDASVDVANIMKLVRTGGHDYAPLMQLLHHSTRGALDVALYPPH